MGPFWADIAEGEIRSDPVIDELLAGGAEISSVVSGGNGTPVRSDGSVLIEFDVAENSSLTSDQVHEIAEPAGWSRLQDATWARCITVIYGGGGNDESQAIRYLYVQLDLLLKERPDNGSQPTAEAGRLLASAWGPNDIVNDGCT